MAPYIEANSLSDITQLASNPPKYPRNPTEKKRDPLTLYISRVPGSRDIILTTLKPESKSVTAGDIANSLYYLHLNTEEDSHLVAHGPEAIPEAFEPNDVLQEVHPKPIREEGTTSTDTWKHLSRKPLPESARSSFEFNRQNSAVPKPLSISSISNVNRKIERKALSPNFESINQSRLDINDQKRPLGPRPLLSESIIGRKPLPGTHSPLYGSGHHPSTSGSPYETKEGPEPSVSDIAQSFTADAPRKTFSVTVIRRDAASGAQWNVGTVVGESHDPVIQSPGSKKGFFDMSVHLTAPGYSQFKTQPTKFPSGANDTCSATMQVQKQHNLRDLSSPSVAGFERNIRMEGTSLWNRSKQRTKSQNESPGIRKTAYGSFSSPESPNFPPGLEEPISSNKGYVFNSPWHGRCKFTTSASGRSLLCKHTLPGSISASNNVTDSMTSSQVAVAVSELRFNLPSLALLHSPISPSFFKGRDPESRRFNIPKFTHIRNKLSPDKVPTPPLPPRPRPISHTVGKPSDSVVPPLPPRAEQMLYAGAGSEIAAEPLHNPDRLHPFPFTSVSSEEEEDDRLDLSLGHEKAGGGNTGDRVKLGKLIITDEGTKMIDLVVAANMGVWWSVWETTS